MGFVIISRCEGDVRGSVVVCPASDRQVRYYSPDVGGDVRGSVVACSASDRHGARYYLQLWEVT